MIDITLDEKNVFAYDAENISIHIFQHRDGKFTGPTMHIGSISFANRGQAYHFSEMIELILTPTKFSVADMADTAAIMASNEKSILSNDELEGD